jgi:hypothetical protein
MPVVRIPLAGSLTSRDAVNTALFGANQKDQFFLNSVTHVVRNELSGKVTTKVGPRESFTLNGVPTAATGNGTAFIDWRGKGVGIAVTAFGSTNSTIRVDNTSLGAITGLGIFFSETLISNVPTITVISDANLAYYYIDGGALTEITDTDFPAKQTPALTLMGNFAHLDGFPFIMTTNGQIWHGNLNTMADWTSTANVSAQEYPDVGMGVARYKNFLVGFSQYSMEFFTNAGNPAGAVLSRAQGEVKQVGLVNQFCLVSVLDTLAFIGQDLRTLGVYILNGGVPEKISTKPIDELLDSGTVANYRLHVMSSHNKPYLAVALTSNTTNVYVYDFQTKQWSPWVLEYAIRQSDVGAGGTGYVGHGATEIVFNSAAGFSSATIQTEPLDLGSKRRKRLRELRLIADKANITSNVSVSWSDDDGQTWSSARTLNLAENDPKLRNGGTFRRRMFKIAGIAAADTNREQLIEAIELDVEEGVL